MDLLKTEEIAAFRSILQVIHNPRLDIPLVAALSSPVFGFSADDLAMLRAKNISCSFYDALLRDSGEKAKQFLDTLGQLRLCLRHFGLTKLLEQVLLLTSLEEIYGAMEEGQLRLSNLQTFFQLASDFEAGGSSDLGSFLEHLEALEEKGLLTSGQESATDCITIMSIHKSKGLEFPVVYLCGLGREFNMESQRGNVLCHKSFGIGLSAIDHKNRLRYPTIAKRAIAAKIGMDSISEELRVLYVAMTRAKDRLIMTYASARLEKDITEIVQRMDMNGHELLIREAVCPGDWVLLTALQKTEAGELFSLSSRPKNTVFSPYPWKIRVVTAPQPVVDTQQEETGESVPQELIAQMQEGLQYRYDHMLATTAPSKQTATGIKGRQVDQEAAENTETAKAVHRQWRKPSFAENQTGGTDYGNALHAAMQYLNYAACTNVMTVQAELERLAASGYLSAQQAQMVDASAVAAFFETELGKQLQQGEVVREFKFSLLLPAEELVDGLTDEQILLQGVVDCAMIENDCITIIDFKSDYVTEETLPQKQAHYALQVAAYARAMECIYQKPVKQKLLYFFHLRRFVAL